LSAVADRPAAGREESQELVGRSEVCLGTVVGAVGQGAPDAGGRDPSQDLPGAVSADDPSEAVDGAIDQAGSPMELSLFDHVADALVGLVPRELGQLRYRARRFGIKVWFNDDAPPREHYEAQVISRYQVGDETVTALEVGFHSEHPGLADNDAVIARMAAAEQRWRPQLGGEAVAGAFIGNTSWRRVSETWPEPDLEDTELAFEVAARLTDYITALEPLREKT